MLAEALPVAGAAAKTRRRFLYEQGPLVMTADGLRDANGAFSLAQLPAPEPKCKVALKGDVTPLTERMWKIALDDVERNQVKHESGAVYFGAGTRYSDRVYTRDISIAGVLGVNRFYPNEMLSSLKLTREIRKGLGYKVSAPHKVSEIDAPWEVIAEVDKEVMAKYKTNSYTRATDDVVWLWAADDLFTLHPELADWKWMLENGEHFFRVFYAPWFDPSDGLYRGQPLFHDITNSAYPDGMGIADCVLLKAISTNCLYYRGLLAMANACEEGRPPGHGKAAVARPRRRPQGRHRQGVHEVRRHARLLQGSPQENHAEPRDSGNRFRGHLRNCGRRRRESGVRGLSDDRQGHPAIFAVHSRQLRAAQHGQLAVLRHLLPVGKSRGGWRRLHRSKRGVARAFAGNRFETEKSQGGRGVGCGLRLLP